MRRDEARPVLILALTATLACSALAQPVPLFYRTDYSINYGQFGEQGSVVIADLNNDGKPDFAIGGGLGIAVALGNGDGTFQPIMNFVPTGGGVNGAWVLSAAAADFDGDGNIDLVLYATNGRSGFIILPGNGDGTFGSGALTTSQGFPPPAFPILTQLLETADLNHDGHPDLVLLTENNNAPLVASAVVFLNNGHGAFTSQIAFNLPSYEYAVGVAIADFNGDGEPDLALIGQVLAGFGSADGHVYIGLGKGDGSFAPPVAVYTLDSFPSFVAVGDFNRDSAPDLAILEGDGVGTLILLNNGDGTFRAGPVISLCFVCAVGTSIVVEDWLGSGFPGLGLADGNEIGILDGNGDGTFSSAAFAALDPFNGVGGAFASADLNGDGLPDLVVPSDGTTVSVLLNAGGSPPLSFVSSSAATGIMSVAPGSIASLYGQFPFSATQTNTTSPPPVELAGVTVTIRDSAGVNRPAPLFYISPTQINLLIPDGTAPGAGAVTIGSTGPPVPGSALVQNVVPAIFTQGGVYPAAYVLTYGPDGQLQPPVPVATCQTAQPLQCQATPIPRPAGSHVFLELFATGIRNHVSPVMAYVSDVLFEFQTLTPEYAGSQGQFEGLDQVNLEITNLPLQSGATSTTYTLTLNVDGFASNAVGFAVQ
jgi:uncharacterized protein (TIGR03437 family)